MCARPWRPSTRGNASPRIAESPTMTTAQATNVLQHLRRMTRRGGTSPLPDGDLVARFAVHGDEDAFAALVERHGPMVWGVCRGVLRDWHDAEDAFQAAFLVLAKKAGSIRSRDSVAS